MAGHVLRRPPVTRAPDRAGARLREAAEAYGGVGIVVESEDELGPALEAAIASGHAGYPRPGEYGILSPGVIEGPGSYTVNANMGKTFQLTESKQLTIRVDATNILNHPAPYPVTTDTAAQLKVDLR